MQRDPHDEPAAGDPHDAAWRSIVENYGERTPLDEEPLPPVDTGAGATTHDALLGAPVEAPRHEPPAEPDDRFVPPDPPAAPRPPADRLAAWAGVLGSPVVVVVLIVLAFTFGLSVPGWVLLLLATAFVGGFCYLVSQMPREPREPWDDGAQV